MSPTLQSRLPIVLAVLVFLICGLLSFYYFQSSPYFEQDTVSYLFQANLFAHLHLTAPPPPDRGFSPSPHLNIFNGRWYSRYPIGNALLLSLGVLAGMPWIVPCLATAVGVLLLSKILARVYDSRTALLGSLLAALSPATLVMGATCFAEVTDRLFLSLYILGMTHITQPAGAVWPLLTGAALGMAFNTRPLTAVAFGLAGAGLWLHVFLTSSSAPRLIRWTAFALLGFAPGLLTTLGWNYLSTGSPAKSSFNAGQPQGHVGFGPRAVGHVVDPAEIFVFTPKQALLRTLTKSTPAIVVNSLGLGYYDPAINQQLLAGGAPAVILGLRMLPGLLTVIIMAMPLLGSSRTRWDVFFGSLVAMNIACYFFYWFDASTWGFTPTHSRYYTEATFLGIVPLLARGFPIVYDRFVRSRWKRAGWVLGIAAVALSVNYLDNYWRYAEPLRTRGASLLHLRQLVHDSAVHHAVIFSSMTAVPLSDYPFTASLEGADILYFRLGPSKQWALKFDDWSLAYPRFFTGRRAYLYQDDHLIPVVQ